MILSLCHRSQDDAHTVALRIEFRAELAASISEIGECLGLLCKGAQVRFIVVIAAHKTEVATSHRTAIERRLDQHADPASMLAAEMPGTECEIAEPIKDRPAL